MNVATRGVPGVCRWPALALGIMATLGLHTVFIPGLLCSARLYDPLLPAAWAHGAVTVADSRRDDTVHAWQPGYSTTRRNGSCSWG